MDRTVKSRNRIKALSLAAVIAFSILALSFAGGCGGGSSSGTSQGAAAPKTTEGIEESQTPKAAGTYVAPPFHTSAFHQDAAETDGVMYIDTSCVSEGYVAVSGTSDSRLKFQVLKDDMTYNYDMASDGTPSIFPLQCGDGTYAFRIMENIVDKKYALVFDVTCDVTLKSEFEPFLRPSNYSDYSEDSKCVQMAAEFAKAADTQPDIISQIYDYVCSHITYDFQKAENLQIGYMPNPDETLSTGTGICVDYASLTAAMMRSQGIPTKIIFGYVAPDDLYHAWNMFYTEDTGWVTVEFKVNEKDWTRIDLTFSANGSDSKFIGDGTNYADVYAY